MPSGGGCLRTTRRQFLATAAVAPAVWAAPSSRRIQVENIDFGYQDYLYRTPMKFGGNVVERVTLLNVNCTVRGRDGRMARGFGSMSMGNVWSFPALPYETTLPAMKALAARVAAITRDSKVQGHPIDINIALEPAYLSAAADVSKELLLPVPIPKLCTLVTFSPFDAAIHDAYGKLCGVSSYHTYGREFMPSDLGAYLSPEFRGEWLDQYILPEPKARMPLYHLVGAVDPITDSDVHQRVGDGLPETLPEWIRYNGITHIKIKLNGSDLNWDVDRVVAVDRATAETQKNRGVSDWVYSLDFNEKCPNVEYLLTFLKQLKERAPSGFARIQYVEQPTKRDLKTDRANVMHQAAKLIPVVIDESLVDLESLQLAREMGYSGVALKSCKGQSQVLLMAAAGQKNKMFLCVQDLTCPGASLIESAGLAAHVPGVAAIEANARQYVPAANDPWVRKFPGIFDVRDGYLQTGTLVGPGLGAVP
jgi:L-alanine-DL-glutamate epimerase-like enolase superfamily enzyme